MQKWLKKHHFLYKMFISGYLRQEKMFMFSYQKMFLIWTDIFEKCNKLHDLKKCSCSQKIIVNWTNVCEFQKYSWMF